MSTDNVGNPGVCPKCGRIDCTCSISIGPTPREILWMPKVKKDAEVVRKIRAEREEWKLKYLCLQLEVREAEERGAREMASCCRRLHEAYPGGWALEDALQLWREGREKK